MSDTPISKMIPKIHLRLLFFFFFLFFIGFFTFIALLEGIHISHIKLGGVKLEQLYLKWDHRLHIKASKIDLSSLADSDESFDYHTLKRIPTWIKWGEKWIDSINIHSLEYKKVKVLLNYKRNGLGKVSLTYNNKTYQGQFSLTSNNLSLSFSHISLSENTTIKGTVLINIPNQTLLSQITLELPKTPLLDAKIQSNMTTLQFNITSQKPIITLNPLCDFLNIDPQTRPWITTYAKADLLVIEKFYGKVHYKSSKPILEQIYAKAHILNASYTFDPVIDPIHAKKVDLFFQNGQLHIIPYQGSFYGLATEKSRLYINFTTKNFMLNAHILTHDGQLNQSILKMLNHYHIYVPIEQIKGQCDVNLKLGIDLHTFDTTAQGSFKPTASEVLLNGFTLQTRGGIVTLDTHKVVFEGIDAYYKNILHASVNGQYDAIKEGGNVKIIPISFHPDGNKNSIFLQQTIHPTTINYLISSKGDRIDVSPSTWSLFGETIKLNAISAPFNYATSTLKLDQLDFVSEKKFSGSISGILNPKNIDLKFQIDKFSYKGIALNQTSLIGKVFKDEKLTSIQVPTKTVWTIGGETIMIPSISANLEKNILHLDNLKLDAQKLFSSNLSGEYNFLTNNGHLTFNNFKPINPKLANYADSINEEKVLFYSTNDAFSIVSEPLGIELKSIANGWMMKIKQIGLLAKKSKLLRQYSINNGQMNLYYIPKKNRYTFDGEVIYPYKIMMTGEKHIEKYRFSGSSEDGEIKLRINDRLSIHYGDQIHIRANNIGFDMGELYRWITNQDQTNEMVQTNDLNETKEPLKKKLTVNITNSFLHLINTRKILVDSLNAQMDNDLIEGRLMYQQGAADFTISHGLFYIEGNHFNDRFMEQLFSYSDFSGGELSFLAKGSYDAMSGIVKIDNATFKEYRLLNNILSFINTVPSLATFSLPNYNTKGLPVKEAYAHFSYQNKLIDVDTFVLNSPEVKLAGQARGNIVKDTIDGEITLKTDLGSSIGKVPVVGYILFGDDGSLSTTLKVSGKLSDPKVDTSIAKEIGIAPFNILKRTVTYPFKWLIDGKK